jgi:hypothetical protein
MKLCAVNISRLFITSFLFFGGFCEANSHLKSPDSKEFLNGLSSFATADEDLGHGSTVYLQHSQEKVSNPSVESFAFLVNLLEKNDKEFILTHLATLPPSEIRSMENELAGMSERDMEDLIQEMLFKGKKEEKWPWSCKRTLNNCAGCTQSCQCKSGRCSWRFVCTNTNDKGYNGCACVMDHDCQSGRCASNLKCDDKLDLGENCLEDDDCKSNVCSWGLKCVGPGNNGSFCFEDEDCHSGRCSNLLECAPKLEEFEMCWKGGNDCKDGSKCISVASTGTGVCIRDETMDCLVEAGNSVPSSLKEEVKNIADSLTVEMSINEQGEQVLNSLNELGSDFIEVLNEASKCVYNKELSKKHHHHHHHHHHQNSIADTSEGQLYGELQNIPTPSLVLSLSADAAYVGGIEIEVGIVNFPGQTEDDENIVFDVVDICLSAGYDFGGDVGVEIGLGFFESPDDVGGFTNCFTAEFASGGGAGAFICGSIINQLFGLGKWNWEFGVSVNGGGGGGANFALVCHSFQSRKVTSLRENEF